MTNHAITSDWDYINHLRLHGYGSAEREFLKQYDAGLVPVEKLIWFEQMHHRRNALTAQMWVVGCYIVLALVTIPLMILFILS